MALICTIYGNCGCGRSGHETLCTSDLCPRGRIVGQAVMSVSEGGSVPVQAARGIVKQVYRIL